MQLLRGMKILGAFNPDEWKPICIYFCLMGSLTFSEMQLSCCIRGKYLRRVQGAWSRNWDSCAMKTEEFTDGTVKPKCEFYMQKTH